ncbi:Tn3 family transposase, partial [Klebsiella pneumoniae]
IPLWRPRTARPPEHFVVFGRKIPRTPLWNECARLVTNAIVYFNSRILSQLLTSFEYQGDTKRIDIVKQASPVAWHNINLKGTYHFELSEKLPDLEELMRSIEGYLPVSEK